MPTTASMSSEHLASYRATFCIDGIEDGETAYCMTKSETAPWLALDYGRAVKVGSVVINNRVGKGDRTKNVKVRVSSTLPASGSEMFSGGQLLGTFEGPGTSGQRIEVSGGTQLTGRYVVVQMDFSSQAAYFNLQEVTAWGQGRISCFSFQICLLTLPFCFSLSFVYTLG